MTESPRPATARRFLGGRRLALLASAAALGAVLFAAGGTFGPNANLTSLTAPAYAQAAQRPAGFADIVEKVKPAVISVRVRVGANREPSALRGDDNSPFGPGSPFEQFFRRSVNPMAFLDFARPTGATSSPVKAPDSLSLPTAMRSPTTMWSTRRTRSR